MNQMPPPVPLVFVLTPRLGDLNHRYLVSATAVPDEHDVQAAFEARSQADDVLAVKVDVSQVHGRIGEEWLIVRDPRIRSLPADRRSAILEGMRSRLSGLVPPAASDAATSSGCVPFPPIDALAREIEAELGRRNRPPKHTRSAFLMPLAAVASAALLGAGIWLVAMQPGPGERPPTVIPRQPDMQQLVARLVDGAAAEDDVVARIREKIAPNLPPNTTLLQALNYLRPLIKQAALDRYDSVADAMKDERMLGTVRATLSTASVDAFLDDDGRAMLRGLDPDALRSLDECLIDWPDVDLANERPPYQAIEGKLLEASREAKKNRPDGEPSVKRVFVYHDATTRGPNLLALFVSTRDGRPTALGQMVARGVQQPPATLAAWLDAAARAHESTGAAAHAWLSREALAMHRRQATDPDSETPGAEKFYEHLDGFLRACRAAVRTMPPPANAVPVPPAAAPTASPSVGSTPHPR